MTDNPVFDRIKQDITDNPVVVFMKGTPMFPNADSPPPWSRC